MWVTTGGISIFAQALDSFLDLFAIATISFAVSIAAKPSNEEHPFGHGKMEDIATRVQAVLIFAAGGLTIDSAAFCPVTYSRYHELRNQ